MGQKNNTKGKGQSDIDNIQFNFEKLFQTCKSNAIEYYLLNRKSTKWMNISQTKGLQNEKKGLQVIEYSQRFCDSTGNNVFWGYHYQVSVPYLSILKMVRQWR